MKRDLKLATFVILALLIGQLLWLTGCILPQPKPPPQYPLPTVLEEYDRFIKHYGVGDTFQVEWVWLENHTAVVEGMTLTEAMDVQVSDEDTGLWECVESPQELGPERFTLKDGAVLVSSKYEGKGIFIAYLVNQDG